MLPKLDSPEEAVARVHPMTKKISTINNKRYRKYLFFETDKNSANEQSKWLIAYIKIM